MEKAILHFNQLCHQAEKGYLFVYHTSSFDQHYHFDCDPQMILSMDEFIDYQHLFHSKTIVVPLVLSKGYIYEKIKQATTLTVYSPLIDTIEAANTLLNRCRKNDKINIFVLHPRSNPWLINALNLSKQENDALVTIDQKLFFEADKDYHVTLLLMTEGQHYHQFIENLPKNVSVSKILPLIPEIKQWIESKIRIQDAS